MSGTKEDYIKYRIEKSAEKDTVEPLINEVREMNKVLAELIKV